MDSLVLYKIHPARVVTVDDKIEIELPGGHNKRVRPKDVDLLHPGPLKHIGALGDPGEGELEVAWELLEGGETTLAELAELMYDDYSPQSAWGTWQRVAEGLYFSGTPMAIRVHTREQVERDRAERAAKAAAERDWQEFLDRMKRAELIAEDRQRLAEVERLALGLSEHSRILQALGHQETAQNAHRALVEVGYWPPKHNPYPERNRLPTISPELDVPDVPAEERRDLTHLPAYAIDDEGNEDPDDALSLDGDRMWVHIADVGSIVAPDDALDLEARARGANQYMPERTVNMLPELVTRRLGLGLAPVSPALSVGFRCSPDGELGDIEIVPSLVRVDRLTYEAVDRVLDEPRFADIWAYLEPFRARRMAENAATIELPEVSVRVQDGKVVIRPLPRLRSRALVTEAMLMAGAAVARYCSEHEIPIPFATQAAPDKIESPTDLAGMFAYRRRFKPTRLVAAPETHFGLGLPHYTRATSPLRRYSDLLVHQQVRARLAGRETLTSRDIAARAGVADTAAVAIRRAERLSNQHWKLVYLKDNPKWRGEGVVVDKEDNKAVLLIPELALETRVRVRNDPPLNSSVQVAPREIDLAELTCYFHVRD